MSTKENKVLEDIQAHNMKLYHTKKRPSSGYYCTKCNGRVSLGSSYSNKGYALQCTCCVIRGQHEENLTLTQYLSQKIWNVEIPVEYWKYLSDAEIILEPLDL